MIMFLTSVSEAAGTTEMITGDIIKDMYNKGVDNLLVNLLNAIRGLMNGSFTSLGSYSEINGNITSFLAGIYTIMGAIFASVLVIISLYKVLKSLISISAGTREYTPVGQIIWDVITASAASIIFPWLLGLVTAFLPIIQAAITSSVINETCNYIADMVANIQNNGWESTFGITMNTPFALLMFCFLAITNFFYYFTVAKFQIDLILLELMAPAAALDKATESKEFYTTWRRTIFSIFISIICKILLNAIVCIAALKLLQTASMGTIYNVWYMVMIGCGICIIKEPEIVKSYKYSSGAGQGMINLLKSAALIVR